MCSLLTREGLTAARWFGYLVLVWGMRIYNDVNLWAPKTPRVTQLWATCCDRFATFLDVFG